MTTITHAKRVYIGTSAERIGYFTADLSHGEFWVQLSGGAGDPTVYVWTGTAWDELGGAGAAHNLLSATHSDTTADSPIQGDVIVADATPAWVRKAKGTAHQLFKMDAAGTAPEWDSFDWDDMAASASADMVHNHNSVAEGGTFARLLGTHLDDVVTADPVYGDLIYGNVSSLWTRLPVGAAYEMLRVDSSGSYPEWAAFDWDFLNQAVAGVDMVHTHESDAEGGVLICNGVNKTVKAAAGDFTTIQGAIDWFENKILFGANTITVDAGAYDEAVVFSGIHIAPGATLTLVGDTRVLAGLTYSDGAAMNPLALTNGGTGTCALASSTTVNANDTITVTGTTTNPDFDADGWGNGDKILTFSNAGAIGEYTISSATNNVIVLTAAGPALGNDATSFVLQPNREIGRTSAGPCITVSACKGVVIDGWFLDSHTGADCHGVQCGTNGMVDVDNCCAYVEDFGFYAGDDYTMIRANSGAVSAWGGSYGFIAATACMILAQYATVVSCSSYGCYASNFACVIAFQAVVVESGVAFQSTMFSNIYANAATARQNTTGYYVSYRGYMWALSTNANNNGNGTNYNPAVTDTFGNANGSMSWS